MSGVASHVPTTPMPISITLLPAYCLFEVSTDSQTALVPGSFTLFTYTTEYNTVPKSPSLSHRLFPIKSQALLYNYSLRATSKLTVSLSKVSPTRNSSKIWGSGYRIICHIPRYLGTYPMYRILERIVREELLLTKYLGI